MPEQTVSMTPTQFQEMMRTIVSEIRKPPVDPVKEAQKAREKKMKDDGNAQRWRSMVNKLIRCQHSREDGTCVISWAVQSDGKERGHCPHCDVPITEDLMKELAVLFPEHKEKLLTMYAEQRQRPRGRKENIRYIA